jgi:hypothetical protein
MFTDSKLDVNKRTQGTRPGERRGAGSRDRCLDGEVTLLYFGEIFPELSFAAVWDLESRDVYGVSIILSQQDFLLRRHRSFGENPGRAQACRSEEKIT